MPWEIVSTDSQVLAIHAALLPTSTRGQILYFGGDEHNRAQAGNPADFDRTRLFDVETGGITAKGSPTTDVFCSGHAFLADGRLLVGGGTEKWPNVPGHGHHDLGFAGHRACWVYRPRAGTWQRIADMNPQPGFEAANTGGGRWYPTLITLASGEVIAVFGHPSETDVNRHRNNTPERYAAAGNRWTILPPVPGSEAIPYQTNFLNYPRLHLLPDGNVFFSTPVNDNRIYDPYSGSFVGPVIAPTGDFLYDRSWDATSVLLPLLPGDNYRPRVLVCGAVQPRRINLADPTPAWTNAGTRTGAAAGRVRQRLSAVLLPTGEVCVTGGVGLSRQDADAVREAEIYSPGIAWPAGTYTGTESWTTAEQAQVVRNYHSVALLMPNGRVWTAGSNKNGADGDPNVVGEKRIEVFKPPYDADPNRPDITSAPSSVGYGESFEVRTPQAASIQRVALIRAGSATHAFDADQRYVGLVFNHVLETDRLNVVAPPNGRIAPPGNYMLWIVDNAGLPCKLAKFIRVSAQRCFIVTDRSTFSSYEVEAQLPPNVPSGPAPFPRSLYVILDGFLPSEIGTPPTTPTLNFTFDSPTGPAVPGMSATLREVKHEDPTLPPDVAQRATFVFDVRFSNADAFTTFPETRNVNLRAAFGPHFADATINLIKQPNPFMMDGETPWLSIDLRVFQMRPGQTRAGVTHGSGGMAPHTFLQQLLPAFNGAPNDEFHPFRDIPTDPGTNPLELSREVNGQRVYNYAVAKVRYRAAAVPAPDVRVFFRLFRCVGTPFNYNTSTTYRRAGSGPSAVPLLGLHGGEIISVPFFASPRVTPSASMTTQPDPLNQRTLNPLGPQESVGYFACWLDFNQTELHMPLNPTSDGPFTGDLKSIQQLMRGDHSCLIAEVHFKPDPNFPDLIAANATPGSSDKLSQRNLALVRSANPGREATRTVQHTFEVKPSDIPVILVVAKAAAGELDREEATDPLQVSAADPRRFDGAAAGQPRTGLANGPDELLISWNNIPRDTVATLHMPDVDADEVINMAALRQGPPVLERVDDHTVRCMIGDVTFVPLPSRRTGSIPGLMTLELPEGVKRGQIFTVTVQQYSGVTRRIIGSFQITIPVDSANVVLPEEIRRLSVLRHVAEAIPPTDHWHRVFGRYLSQIADRVRGLGGDPDRVKPSPDGTGGVDRGVKAFVHRVTAQNISDIFPCTTYLDHPLTNGNPNAILFVTHNWNPLGMSSDQGQFNNHPIGVWFDEERQQWAIYNEDEAAMVEGVAFNVSVFSNLLP